MLRRVLSFIAIVGVAFLWACDNGAEGEPSDSLIGTWSATAFNAEIESSTTFDSETITVGITVEGSNFDYTITFTDSEFSTSGSYETSTTSIIDGQSFGPFVTEVTNVSGSGPYTSGTNEIRVGDFFFSLQANGQPLSTGGEPQTLNYTITGNQLVLSQNETITFTEQGITSSITVEQSSTWTRQ